VTGRSVVSIKVVGMLEVKTVVETSVTKTVPFHVTVTGRGVVVVVVTSVTNTVPLETVVTWEEGLAHVQQEEFGGSERTVTGAGVVVVVVTSVMKTVPLETAVT
jgi:hypothetical protein